MLSSSVMVVPSVGNSARYSDGSFTDVEDIYITINDGDETEPEFFAIEPPRALVKNESLQNEKQISVDPISLTRPNIRQASFRLVSPPKNGTFGSNPRVPFPPTKLKFVSGSLPSSASSSPRHGLNLLKKIWKNKYDERSQPPPSNLSRMQSAMDDTHLALRETDKRRSRSCGERRSSSTIDDFDLWLEKSNNSKGSRTTNRNHSKPPLGPTGEERMKKIKTRDGNFPDQDGFKCGKLCLFLPRGKGKPIRSVSSASTATQVSIMSTEGPVISRTVSLERFECGSWSSSGLDDNEGQSANLFFDLPMELLRCSVSDMQSPVTAAFVFDNDDDDHNGETQMDPESSSVVNNASKKSQARDNFEAFFQAQST